MMENGIGASIDYLTLPTRKKDAHELIDEAVAVIAVCIEVGDPMFGRIMFATPRASKLYGYFGDELTLKQPLLHKLIPDRDGLRERHDQHLRRFAEAPMDRPMGDLQMSLVGWNEAEGREFPVEIELRTGEMYQGKRAALAIVLRARG